MTKLSSAAMAASAAALAVVAGTATWATASASAAPAKSAAPSAVIPRCQPGQLYVWVSPNSAEGTAGTTYFHLDFTNISRSECHLYAWPGVSATNANGKQLGVPAIRNADVPARYVNILSGGTAHSNLGYVDVQVTPQCKMATAMYLKVYPPGSTGSRNAFFPLRACTNKTYYLTTGRLQPGV